MTSYPSFVYGRNAICYYRIECICSEHRAQWTARWCCEFNVLFEKRRKMNKNRIRVGCEQRKKTLCLSCSPMFVNIALLVFVLTVYKWSHHSYQCLRMRRPCVVHCVATLTNIIFVGGTCHRIPTVVTCKHVMIIIIKCKRYCKLSHFSTTGAR